MATEKKAVAVSVPAAPKTHVPDAHPVTLTTYKPGETAPTVKEPTTLPLEIEHAGAVTKPVVGESIKQEPSTGLDIEKPQPETPNGVPAGPDHDDSSMSGPVNVYVVTPVLVTVHGPGANGMNAFASIGTAL
jgi:hypothetical protein